MGVLVKNPPCVVYEDEHLLVVNKPAGWNTHSPSPFHGEGIHEWLKHREPRWANLAIIHRLDKQTSGVLVFAKTVAANRSLTEQFATRKTRKIYQLLTTTPLPREKLIVRSKLSRLGEKYVSGATGEFAETHFMSVRPQAGTAPGRFHQIIAAPLTGRTHQIRVQASENGFPIVGDATYGGVEHSRVCLHSSALGLRHPVTSQSLLFEAPPHFDALPAEAYRRAFIDDSTNAWRCLHGESDLFPGYYLERWGDFLLLSGECEPSTQVLDRVEQVFTTFGSKGLYHKTLSKKVRSRTLEESTPRLIRGTEAPDIFTIQENGVRYEASFQQGYSVGLFLDQRDNRRRLLTGHVAAHFPPLALREKTVLNTFAYTCAFSVCAALGGAKTTSLDLSKKYLDWGRRNFQLNQLDPALHDFIYGDVFEWADRLLTKGRSYDIILLDPPTFSQAKSSGIFQAERHYGELVRSVLPLLKPDGILFASTNAQKYRPEQFLKEIQSAIQGAQRKITHQHFVPQPPDFPISREEPGFLKTVWMRIG